MPKLNIYLDDETMERVWAMAKRFDTSASWVVRRALHHFFEQEVIAVPIIGELTRETKISDLLADLPEKGDDDDQNEVDAPR